VLHVALVRVYSAGAVPNRTRDDEAFCVQARARASERPLEDVLDVAFLRLVGEGLAAQANRVPERVEHLEQVRARALDVTQVLGLLVRQFAAEPLREDRGELAHDREGRTELLDGLRDIALERVAPDGGASLRGEECVGR